MAFAKKKRGGGGVGPQNQRFQLKKFFFRRKSAKRGSFLTLGTSTVYALVETGEERREAYTMIKAETINVTLLVCASFNPRNRVTDASG